MQSVRSQKSDVGVFNQRKETKMKWLMAIFAAAALCAAERVDAATKAWTGAVNNHDWTEPGNYQGGLPDRKSVV